MDQPVLNIFISDNLKNILKHIDENNYNVDHTSFLEYKKLIKTLLENSNPINCTIRQYLGLDIQMSPTQIDDTFNLLNRNGRICITGSDINKFDIDNTNFDEMSKTIPYCIYFDDFENTKIYISNILKLFETLSLDKLWSFESIKKNKTQIISDLYNNKMSLGSPNAYTLLLIDSNDKHQNYNILYLNFKKKYNEGLLLKKSRAFKVSIQNRVLLIHENLLKYYLKNK